MVFIRHSFLTVISLCSFVCFHVTANISRAENAGWDETNSDQLLMERENAYETKNKRTPYQTPVLSNPSSALNEDYPKSANWPSLSNVMLGQVAGVCVSGSGEVVVFHRGDHVWDSQSFDRLNQYLQKDSGPIPSHTVLVFHPDTGALLHQWGESMFYLPHGVTIDQEENIWLTDVALHQVFKFPPLSKNERTPLLALGKAFTPGNSAVRFCKPTSVAITSWGDFFVADGYCNSRLIKFNKAGVKIMEIGHATFNFGGLAPPDPYSFSVPHALTLAEDRKLVCVADRENGRVLCFDWNNGTFVFHISSPQIGSLVYSVTYSPVQGGLFFLVNGEERFKFGAVPVRGYVLSASNLRLLSYFGPELKMPHDLAVSPDAMHIFVGEIGPNAVHKYSTNRTLRSPVLITTSPKSAQAPETAFVTPRSLSLTSPQGTVLPAVLVTCAAVLFGAAILTAALVYSRARRRVR